MMTKRTLTMPGYDVSRSESLTRSSAEPGDRRFVESRHQYLAPEFVDRGLVLVDRLGRGLRVVGAVLRRIGDLITRFADPFEMHPVGRAEVAAPRETVFAEDAHHVAVHVRHAALAVRHGVHVDRHRIRVT